MSIIAGVLGLVGTAVSYFTKREEMRRVERMIEERRREMEQAIKAYQDSYSKKYSEYLASNSDKIKKEARSRYLSKKVGVTLSLMKKYFFDYILWFVILFLLLSRIIKKNKQ